MRQKLPVDAINPAHGLVLRVNSPSLGIFFLKLSLCGTINSNKSISFISFVVILVMFLILLVYFLRSFIRLSTSLISCLCGRDNKYKI